MRHFLFIAAFSLLLFGCKKKDVNDCETPNFQLSQSSNAGEFLFQATSGTHGFYEIQYGPNGFSFGSGTTVNLNSFSTVSGLSGGAYDVYVRGNCGGSSWSDWSNPSSILVTGGGGGNSCSTPTNLHTTNYSYSYQLTWDYPSNTADYYEVEYGPQGFSQGSGITRTTSSESYSGGSFAQGNTYSFYVRSYCTGGEWSNWAGPKSFYADNNANMCLPPTGTDAYRYNGYIRVEFTPNGEDEHQVCINNTNSTTWGDIYDLETAGASYSGYYTNVTYYVFFRSKCNNGDYSNWVGPKIVPG